jgi:putative photosynthetic complex assembly protein 2
MMFGAVGGAVVYTIFLWWFSTGAILWLNRRPSPTYRRSLIAASVLAIASAGGLAVSMTDPSPAGAVLAFTCALGLWGWNELSFLTGFISGPRTNFCPPNALGWRRFRLATTSLLYHEIALVLTAGVIIAVTWRQPNQIGCWTFLILFVSRLSAKLNLFLGVPNFTDEFLPDRLRYLSSYMRRGPMNALFPLSVTAGLLLAGLEGRMALAPAATTFQAVGFSLMFTLTALALIEHAFMVLPLPDAALWRWALPASPKGNNAS